MSRSTIRLLLRLVFLATAGWGVLHLANDALWHARAFREPARLDTPPGQWRVGSPTWRRFALTMDTIAHIVPHGEQIAVRAPAERWLLAWYAAYLLPHHHVLPVSRNPQPKLAPYAVSLEEPWRHPALELIHQSPNAWVYHRALP